MMLSQQISTFDLTVDWSGQQPVRSTLLDTVMKYVIIYSATTAACVSLTNRIELSIIGGRFQVRNTVLSGWWKARNSSGAGKGAENSETLKP